MRCSVLEKNFGLLPFVFVCLCSTECVLSGDGVGGGVSSLHGVINANPLLSALTSRQ